MKEEGKTKTTKNGTVSILEIFVIFVLEKVGKSKYSICREVQNLWTSELISEGDQNPLESKIVECIKNLEELGLIAYIINTNASMLGKQMETGLCESDSSLV